MGCKIRIESEQELIDCPELKETSNEEENLLYKQVFGNNVKEMVKVAQVIKSRLKVRKKLLEDPP